MDYLHNRDRSLSCLRSAVTLMGRHSALLDPISYAVWYDYAAGGSADLRRSLDDAVAGGTLVSPEQTRELFVRHIAPPGGGLEIERLGQLMGLATAVSESTAQARQANDRLGRSLSSFHTQLQVPPQAQVQALNEAVVDMRQVSAQTQDSIREVANLLAQQDAELKRLRDELDQARQEAAIDGLTQVLNRRAFDRALQACCNPPGSGQEAPSDCLLLLDIDNFKALNDSFGHAFGDEVLRALGRALRSVVQPGDSVGRFGGDEFALLLRTRALDAVQDLAERVRGVVAAGRIRDGQGEQHCSVTVSVGVASAGVGETALQWLQRADAALYEAKRGGRNRVCWAS